MSKDDWFDGVPAYILEQVLRELQEEKRGKNETIGSEQSHS